MSPLYAFVAGAILVAIGAFLAGCAGLNYDWFFRFSRAAREARWFGREAARWIYVAGGGFAIFLGVCFWLCAGFLQLSLPGPAAKAGPQPPRVNPVQHANQAQRAENSTALGPRAALYGGYSIKPPKDFTQHTVTRILKDDHWRLEYQWNDPADAERFLIVALENRLLPGGGERDLTGGYGSLIHGRLQANQLHDPSLARLTVSSSNDQPRLVANLQLESRHLQLPSEPRPVGVFAAATTGDHLIEILGVDPNFNRPDLAVWTLQRDGHEAPLPPPPEEVAPAAPASDSP